MMYRFLLKNAFDIAHALIFTIHFYQRVPTMNSELNDRNYNYSVCEIHQSSNIFLSVVNSQNVKTHIYRDVNLV